MRCFRKRKLGARDGATTLTCEVRIIMLARCSSGSTLTTWRFSRSDDIRYASPSYDDSSWFKVDVPHDWSAEDLPTREDDKSTPVLEVRSGSWRFAPLLGNASFAAPTFDDSSWANVTTPSDWHSYGVTKYNATGWFRKRVVVTPSQLDAARTGQLRLAIRRGGERRPHLRQRSSSRCDGRLLQQHSCVDALTYRSYAVPFAALTPGVNVIAVNVWSSNGPIKSTTKDFMYSVGALPAGGDVEPPRSMHVEDALARCNATVGCYGITYKSTKKRPTNEVKIFFKTERISNGQKGWQSWIARTGQPGGLVDAAKPGDLRIGMYDPGASPGQRQTGYTVGGLGWYRTTFETPSAAAELLFEGCYMNCTVFLNGEQIEYHPYGYTQFAIRVPRSLLNSAAPNVLAVRVNNSGSNSRWYSGSGLHRPVTLLTYSKMHIVPPHAGGVYVLTPNVKLHSNGTVADADANVSIAVQNEDGTAPSKPTRLRLLVCDGGALIASAWVTVPSIAAASTVNTTSLLKLQNARTWSPDQPHLFTLVACLEAACASMPAANKCPSPQGTTDEVRETFGVRSFSFSADRGLLLNGKEIKYTAVASITTMAYSVHARSQPLTFDVCNCSRRMATMRYAQATIRRREPLLLHAIALA